MCLRVRRPHSRRRRAVSPQASQNGVNLPRLQPGVLFVFNWLASRPWGRFAPRRRSRANRRSRCRSGAPRSAWVRQIRHPLNRRDRLAPALCRLSAPQHPCPNSVCHARRTRKRAVPRPSWAKPLGGDKPRHARGRTQKTRARRAKPNPYCASANATMWTRRLRCQQASSCSSHTGLSFP